MRLIWLRISSSLEELLLPISLFRSIIRLKRAIFLRYIFERFDIFVFGVAQRITNRLFEQFFNLSHPFRLGDLLFLTLFVLLVVSCADFFEGIWLFIHLDFSSGMHVYSFSLWVLIFIRLTNKCPLWRLVKYWLFVLEIWSINYHAISARLEVLWLI